MTCDNWLSAFNNLFNASLSLIPIVYAIWGMRIILNIFRVR